jgi:predicted nucleotidyltransferase component of viral defense system|nr:nucleotidyl transferase AbiEii/AbiGii toxin family protein [uncultured Acetatifactor sp.]
MKLHGDKFSFLNIIGLIHDVTGIREDILEKDYYVTLLLKELSEKQESLPAYFKGGTALYKARKSIRRFSEDIDLTICIDGCSGSQAKKRLETATKKYLSLPRTSRKELEEDRKGSITAVYDYTPAVTVDTDDPLQRFGYVKVEGTSFTVSEPFSALEIEPIIYTYATEEQRAILRESFDVMPFPVKTIRLERIFADKIFAAEFYYGREMYFDVAKHIYDVGVMLDMQPIQHMLGNAGLFLEMAEYKRLEETRRTGSDLADRKFSDFELFRGFPDDTGLREAYQNMQRNYVFSEKDLLPFEFVANQWKKLQDILNSMDRHGNHI